MKKERVALIVWAFFFIIILLNQNFIEKNLDWIFGYSSIAVLISITFLQILFSIIVLPCSPFTVLCGLILGFSYGFIYSIFCTVISVIVTYYLFQFAPTYIPHRRTIESLSEKVFSHFVGCSSTMVVILLQMNPLLPGSSLGYVFRYLNIRLLVVIIGTIFGTLMPQLLMTAIGASLQDFLSGDHYLTFFIYIIIYLLLLIVMPIFFRKTTAG